MLSTPAESLENPSLALRSWTAGHRIFFRFAFSYLVVYNFPFPLGNWPIDGIASPIDDVYGRLWDAVVPWVARHVLHLRHEVLWRPNFSTDTTYNWVQVFCFLVIAVVATIVWSVVDRKRPAYPRLFRWLRVYARCYLAWALLRYGVIKLAPIQFPAPGLDRLVQPFGDASTLGLLWTSMGASRLYSGFSGLAEMVAGALIAFPATTLLGSLISMGVMSNVVALNFSYDVGVKLYSLHLLAMSCFLALPDARRLLDFFVWNRLVPPQEPADSGAPSRNRMALIATTMFVVTITATMLWITFHQVPAQSPLRGIWTVDDFKIDGQAIIPESQHWRRVIFDDAHVMAVQDMNESVRRFSLDWDPSKKTVEIRPYRKPAWAALRDDLVWTATLSVDHPDATHLNIEGVFDNLYVRAACTLMNEPRFYLMNSGFHWVNEYPDLH
jgi:hypothetical protein